MGPRVRRVRYAGDYRVELEFSDGLQAVVDLKHRVLGREGVFKPFADAAFFSRVALEPEAGTIAWPNGVDFCPDVLYGLATGALIDIPEPARRK